MIPALVSNHDATNSQCGLCMENNTMSSFWQENLGVLQQYHPDMFSLVSDHDYSPVGEIIPTPAGIPSMRFFASDGQGPLAYNIHDPWLDTAIHLQTIEEGSRGLALFIGMGLGYGLLRVLHERPSLGMMVVVEPCLDLLVMALQQVDLRPLLESKKVHWLVGEDVDLSRLEALIGRIAALEQTHLLRYLPGFQWREGMYMPVNQQVFQVVNQINVAGGTTSMAGEKFFRNRLANLSLIRHSVDLGILRDLFAGKPAVLVAAGPSLDKSIADLKKVAGRCVLFAVDSALAPLLKAGIIPDFVTSIDFSSLNFEKIAPFSGGDWPFSLIVTIKGTPLIPKRLKARHLVLAFNEDAPQNWICNALAIKDLAPFAFSVAHLSLGVALQMGCNPITFVGQDLGYTTGAADHAAGTVIMKEGLPADREIFQVPGVNGNLIATDRGMMSLQKRFEDIIAENPGRTYYNATAAGVHIQGTEPVALDILTARYMSGDLPVQDIVGQAVAARAPFPVAALLSESEKILKTVETLDGQLDEISSLIKGVNREVVRLRQKKASIHAFDRLPGSLANKLIKFDRINKAIDAAHDISEQILELTYPVLKENDRLREKNEEVRAREGYLAWLLAEVARIDMVNRERRKALALYRELLQHLSLHLFKEGELARAPATLPELTQYLALARLYVANGDYQLARGVIASAQALAPDSGEALLLSGEICAGLLDFSRANAAWQEAIAQAPECAAEVRELRLKHAGFWVAMADECGNAGELGDNFLQLLPVWLGRVAALLPDGEEIPDSLQCLWKKHSARMEEWLATGEIEHVAETLSGWEAFGLRFPEVLVFQAQLAAAKGDSATAIASMEQVILQNPEQPQWLAFQARLFLETGRFDEGLARLQAAVALAPETAVLWEELGDTLSAEGDVAGAIIAFERCYLALPHRVDVLRKMGDCLLRNNQSEAAIVAYEAVLAKDPANEPARLRLSQAQILLTQ